MFLFRSVHENVQLAGLGRHGRLAAYVSQCTAMADLPELPGLGHKLIQMIQIQKNETTLNRSR